jgi:hypothetical protein
VGIRSPSGREVDEDEEKDEDPPTDASPLNVQSAPIHSDRDALQPMKGFGKIV